MNTGVTADMLTDLVDSIFTTMMQLPVAPVPIANDFLGDKVTACVYLEGDWNGAVSIECSRGQARQFAGLFMQMDATEVVEDDLRDVLGEIANIIGGNFKSMMSKNVQLSMPSVIDGTSYELRFCGAEIQHRIAFSDAAGGTFWVTVLCSQYSNRAMLN